METFPFHRYQQIKNYYTGRNFGSIDITWGDSDSDHTDDDNTVSHLQVNIHDIHGNVVLSTGRHPLSFFGSRMTNQQLRNVVGVSDGHLIPHVKNVVVIIILMYFWRYTRRAKAASFDVKKKKI